MELHKQFICFSTPTSSNLFSCYIYEIWFEDLDFFIPEKRVKSKFSLNLQCTFSIRTIPKFFITLNNRIRSFRYPRSEIRFYRNTGSRSDATVKPDPDPTLQKNQIPIRSFRNTGSGSDATVKPDPDPILQKHRIRRNSNTGSGSDPAETNRTRNPDFIIF